MENKGFAGKSNRVMTEKHKGKSFDIFKGSLDKGVKSEEEIEREIEGEREGEGAGEDGGRERSNNTRENLRDRWA